MGLKKYMWDVTAGGNVISINKKGDIINNYFNEYYIANKEVDITKLQLQKEEVSEVKWIDKDEIEVSITSAKLLA